MIDDSAPRPKSALRRFLFRAAIIQLILLLVLLAAHAIWARRASVALKDGIAQIEARGEPMTVAALQPAIPPDDQNGYVELKQAMAIVESQTKAGETLKQMPDWPQYPWRDDERALIKTYLAEREAARPLMDRAAAKPACVMDRQLQSPLMIMQLPELAEFRGVSMWLGLQAVDRAEQGDHALAVKRLREIDLPMSAAGSYPLLVGHLVAASCRAVQADTIMSLAPDLKIGNEPGAVSPTEVRRLLAELLDSSPIEAEQLRAFQGERVMQVDALLTLGFENGTQSARNSQNSGGGATANPSALKRYLWQPYVDSNALGCVEATTEILPLLASPDWPTGKAAFSTWKAKHAPAEPSRMRALAAMMAGSLVRATEAKYRLIATRNLAATALAVRWYRVENGGAWPESLEAMVPKYLPLVPKDPMSAGGVIRYRGGEKPTLWSVGTNGVDDNGDETVQGPRDGDWDRPDRVVHLTVQPRPMPVEATQETE